VTDPSSRPVSDSDGPSRVVLITGLVLGIAAVGTILVIAASHQRPSDAPVAIASAPAPAADSPGCQALQLALPDRLGDYERAPLVHPAPAGTAAWREPNESDPVIVRCGLDRPAEFVVGSAIQVVNSVQWFRIDDSVSDISTWVAVDRSVYVALTLPKRSGPTPIQRLSDAIARSLPAEPIRPGPPR
jgi:hypothetical protein